METLSWYNDVTSPLMGAQQEVSGAYQTLGTSNQIDWVSTNADLYLAEVATLMSRIEVVQADIESLRQLSGQLEESMDQICWAVF